MGLIIGGLLLIAAIAAFFGRSFRIRKNGEGSEEATFKNLGSASIIGALLFVLAIGSCASIGQIGAGHRGVVLQFGAVTERTLPEGLYFITPFAQSVEKMNVQTQAFTTPVAAASKDLQDVNTEVTLNYRLNPALVNTIYQSLRREYEPRIVMPSIQESVKAVTAQFDAEELITRRPAVKLAIEDALRGRLGSQGIELITLSITNFQFSETFSASIEAKQVAAQRALEATNRLRQIEVEAQQAKASAEGRKEAAIQEAEGARQAAILRAEGEAQAIQLTAEAQAEANRRLNETLTRQVIEYSLVQQLAPGIQTIVLPSGQEFILGEGVLTR